MLRECLLSHVCISCCSLFKRAFVEFREVEVFLRRVRAGSVPVLYTDIKEAAQR